MSVIEQFSLEMCREQAGGVRWCVCLFWSEELVLVAEEWNLGRRCVGHQMSCLF